MNSYIRSILCLYITLLLASCATPVIEPGEDTGDTGQAQPGKHQASYKYAAWRLDDAAAYQAINGLLAEADELMAQEKNNAAEDKLERVLRIRPDYAPAWSRMSWLALKMNAPQRAVQMARRSNSFAQSDVELQRLNWTFIRAASQILNDDESYFQANQKIESLKPF